MSVREATVAELVGRLTINLSPLVEDLIKRLDNEGFGVHRKQMRLFNRRPPKEVSRF